MELIFIIILGFVMGIVTSISGGAGVFALPMMLAFGLPPVNVLALNRISDLGVGTGALRGYIKSKSIDWRLAFIIAIPMFVGSFLGAKFVVNIPEILLKKIILAGVFVGIFFLIKKPKVKEGGKQSSLSVIGLILMFLVGVWDGALAMAGATFAVLVLVHFFHKNFLQARSTDIIAAIPDTIIAVTVLSLSSTVSLLLAVCMFASSFVGAWVGSHLAVKHGNEFIRKAMVLIAIVMIIKVGFDLFLK